MTNKYRNEMDNKETSDKCEKNNERISRHPMKDTNKELSWRLTLSICLILCYVILPSLLTFE